MEWSWLGRRSRSSVIRANHTPPQVSPKEGRTWGTWRIICTLIEWRAVSSWKRRRKLSTYRNKDLLVLLENLDLGSSVAESDTVLESARIETSAFSDLLSDRVDLIPGTKGSGKSALFRIFVDFLPDFLLRERKVVVAHGIQAPGDPVFHAFLNRFSALSEEEFVSFWCIYLVSLAHEQFIKGRRYSEFLTDAGAEIQKFRAACASAKIPEIEARKSFKGHPRMVFARSCVVAPQIEIQDSR